ARVTVPVRSAPVRAVLVAAADEVGKYRRVAIDDDRDGIGQPDGADEAGVRAGRAHDLGLIGKDRFAGNLRQLGSLDFVELVVAAYAQRDQAVGAADEERLDALFRLHAEERAHFLDRLLRRRCHTLG